MCDFRQGQPELLRKANNKIQITVTFAAIPPIQFMVGGQGLHKINVTRPKGTTQKLIFNELDEIRSLRNRIAHHEPLCLNRR